jgi:hypothetical protein
MLLIDVLVDADETALQHGKEAFKSVRVSIAADPFELGMINRLMVRDGRIFVMLRLIRNKKAVRVHMLPDKPHNAAMIHGLGPKISAAFNEAQNLWVMGATAETSRALRLARSRQFGFIGFHDLAEATELACAHRSHGETDAMAKVPSRLEATAQRALKLAGRDAFLAAAK